MVLDQLNALSGYVIAGGGAVVGWAGSMEKRLRTHKGRIDDVQRHLTGDTHDPDAPGLLEKVDDLNRDIEHIDAKLEQAREERRQEHERVLDRLDDLETTLSET